MTASLDDSRQNIHPLNKISNIHPSLYTYQIKLDYFYPLLSKVGGAVLTCAGALEGKEQLKLVQAHGGVAKLTNHRPQNHEEDVQLAPVKAQWVQRDQVAQAGLQYHL